METQIYLKENESVLSSNVENLIDVSLSTKTKLLPNDGGEGYISLFDIYNRERNACSKYRLILDVNAVCSNVIHNYKSEIVKNEGSDECISVVDGMEFAKENVAPKAMNTTSAITYLQMIRDTEYSHPQLGGFTYHCGTDIFNNHMLRNDGFAHVNKLNAKSSLSGDTYNTLFDFLRDGRGTIVSQDFNGEVKSINGSPMHLYQYDTVLSFKDAFLQRCKEVDGWWGFVNAGNISIPNSDDKTIDINKMMAKNKACEFIDMYPDRSLYSFIPKYNKYRNRTEANWDYCLTYPYSADTEMINTICGGEYGAIRAIPSIRYNAYGNMSLQLVSPFKHNLKVGSTVYLYYTNADGDVVRMADTVKVTGVGDGSGKHTDRIFSVSYYAVQDVLEEVYPIDEDGNVTLDRDMYFKRVSNGTECGYYIKLLKKIGDFTSDLNKLAFAENIYGDRLAQIIYTDDVNIDGLLDNNGRPVSEIYLTVVKRNKGNEEWYSNDNPIYGSEDIEYSHCFGKVTSGIDFGGLDEEFNSGALIDYNIHYLNNMPSEVSDAKVGRTLSAWGYTVLNHPSPKVLEDELTIENDVFYGDVVEYDYFECTETVIGEVYHRFNTAQRESWNPAYANIYQDIIYRDDYDVSDDFKPFLGKTYYVNDTNASTTEITERNVNTLIYGNISPEGMYYKPHFAIKIREERENVYEAPCKYINFAEYEAETRNSINLLTVEMPTQYNIVKGDFLAFYDKETKKLSWCEVFAVSGLSLTLAVCEDIDYDRISGDDKKMFLFWPTGNTTIPSYAKFSPTTQKFVWRGTYAPSEIPRGADLYDLPFSNGRFYLHKGVNLFLKRQDPEGKYGLSYPLGSTLNNPMSRYAIGGYARVDITRGDYYLGTTNNICL